MERLVNNRETAKLLNLRPQTLRKWRTAGKGPRYVRMGGPRSRVAYRRSDIEEWLAKNTFAHTAEETVCAEGSALVKEAAE